LSELDAAFGVEIAALPDGQLVKHGELAFEAALLLSIGSLLVTTPLLRVSDELASVAAALGFVVSLGAHVPRSAHVISIHEVASCAVAKAKHGTKEKLKRMAPPHGHFAVLSFISDIYRYIGFP